MAFVSRLAPKKRRSRAADLAMVILLGDDGVAFGVGALALTTEDGVAILTEDGAEIDIESQPPLTD